MAKTIKNDVNWKEEKKATAKEAEELEKELMSETYSGAVNPGDIDEKGNVKEEAKKEKAKAKAKAKAPERSEDQPTCLCGCGQSPQSKKGSFVQGHDAKLLRKYKAVKLGLADENTIPDYVWKAIEDGQLTKLISKAEEQIENYKVKEAKKKEAVEKAKDIK